MNEITEDELKAIKNHILLQIMIRMTEKEINESGSVTQRTWKAVLAGFLIHHEVSHNELKARGIWVSDRGEKQSDDIVTYRYAKRGHSDKFPLSKQTQGSDWTDGGTNRGAMGRCFQTKSERSPTYFLTSPLAGTIECRP